MTDLILHNANVCTLDDAHPRANALAVRGEHIAHVGGDEAVLASATPNATIVDLEGATVLPGLIDAHCHLRNLGRLQELVQLYEARSMDEVVELVRERSRDVPRGEWIVGRGWDQERWPGRSMPSHQLLTSAVPDHPVWLVRVDAHAGLANAAAMRAATSLGMLGMFSTVMVAQRRPGDATGLGLDSAGTA